jgi:GNAT superfamily N-acetyltransferase
MEFNILKRNPTVKEYNELRSQVEWPILNETLVEQGLANSLHAVVVEFNGKPIGMGRIVGDNAIYLHIQDVIVRPEFQRQGVGKLIMNELLAYVENIGGKNTNVGLMSSKGREPFYKNFGFIERPSDKFGAGMIWVK